MARGLYFLAAKTKAFSTFLGVVHSFPIPTCFFPLGKNEYMCLKNRTFFFHYFRNSDSNSIFMYVFSFCSHYNWGPPVISWFRFAPVTIVTSTINHSYWSYVHQLSYRTGGPHIARSTVPSHGWGCTASTPTLVSKLWLATPRRWFGLRVPVRLRPGQKQWVCGRINSLLDVENQWKSSISRWFSYRKTICFPHLSFTFG